MWKTIDSAPENKPVLTKIDDAHGVRNEQKLTKWRSFWWYPEPENAVYVYYTPTHWWEE